MYTGRGEYLASLLVRNFRVSLWKPGDRLSVMLSLKRFVLVYIYLEFFQKSVSTCMKFCC